jgi:hypothetical protein
MMKKWREANPVHAAYQTLKANAARRGKDFTISFSYFKWFCVKTQYIAGKGRSADSYHVDRIDEARGYVPGNLQVLTNAENVIKYLSYDWETKTGIVRKGGAGKEKDLPF